MNLPFPHLFSTRRIGGMTLRNRLCHAATLTNFAEAHLPSQRHVDYYEARARGGVGLIITEAIPVHPKSVPTALVIAGFDRRAIEGLRRIADAVHRHGVPILAQLWHVGRQQLWTPISAPWAPSPLPDPLSGTIPHEMSRAEIRELVQAFATTAAHMREAGFDGVELHGAHGYLITQFLSPWSNQRHDEYGGSTDNRMRFLVEIIEAIRTACPADFVVGVKMNGHEFVDGGIDAAEAQRIATRLAVTGAVDLLGVSQGNFSKSLDAHAPDMHFPHAPFRQLARQVKEAAGRVPVYAMARITNPAEAEALLEAGDADLVAMSRALIADPALPRKARGGEAGEIRPCIFCNVCWGAIPQGKPLMCIHNPGVGRESEIDPDAPPTAARTRRVVVVGGGLAGLEASRVAALRGHEVTLLERSGTLGGQANLAARLPGRAEFGTLTRDLVRRVRSLPVAIRLGVEGTAAEIVTLAPEVVIVATGGRPPDPALPGARPGQVVTSWDALEHPENLGERVAIVDADGEHEGSGLAELLSGRGMHVWLLTPHDVLAVYANYLSRIGIMRRLLRNGVHVLTATVARRVSDRALVVANLYSDQEQSIDDIDSVVLVGPNRAEDSLVGEIEGRVPEVHVIGDCYAPRKAVAAIHEGHRVGRLI